MDIKQLLQKLTNRVNRLEIIDYTASEIYAPRAYVKWDDKIKVKLDFQDEGKTLKIFIEEK